MPAPRLFPTEVEAMKRYVANIRVELSSESKESLDCLLETITDRLNKKPRPAMTFIDVGSAELRRATLSRVRPVKPKKRAD
jgi:hypothetical protein